MGTAAPGETAETREPLTIDELARRAGLPVRTIREYHTMRLLPPPQRRGRLGMYGDRHVQRLRLIIRLQRRGYSLAGIRDLLAAWESGTDLVTVLGVDQSQAALDEPPLWLTRAALLQRLPALEQATLGRASRIGLVRPHGEDHFGVRSPAPLRARRGPGGRVRGRRGQDPPARGREMSIANTEQAEHWNTGPGVAHWV